MICVCSKTQKKFLLWQSQDWYGIIGEILYCHWIIFHVSGVYTSGYTRPIPACWQLSVYLGGRLLCGFLWRYSRETIFPHLQWFVVWHLGSGTAYAGFDIFCYV